MIPTDAMMKKTISGLIGVANIEKQVTKKWQEKTKCLQNLTNNNKHELQKIELKLLKGMHYKEHDCETLWVLLKKSDNINEYQKEFALYLYNNYPKHSIKAQGFD